MVVKADGSEAVVITISSRLSGTYQSAVIASGDFEGKVYVVDSQNIALSSAIMVEYALRLADEGKSAAAIAEKGEQYKGNKRKCNDPFHFLPPFCVIYEKI